jgi:hypothetical protein
MPFYPPDDRHPREFNTMFDKRIRMTNMVQRSIPPCVHPFQATTLRLNNGDYRGRRGASWYYFFAPTLYPSYG